MSKKQTRFFAMLVVLVALGLTAFAFASARKEPVPSRKIAGTLANDAADQLPQSQPLNINRRSLDRHVVRALDGLGNRFERAGNERVTLLGTLIRYTTGGGQASSITIVRELSNKLRYEEQGTGGVRVLGFDGSRLWSTAGDGNPTTEEAKLVEALVRDSIEHFVTGQARGDATRLLGDRFRLDDGSNPNYAGPYYDILQVVDTFTVTGEVDQRPTLCYLNSQTGLPDRMVYARDTENRIEVEFKDWTSFLEQQLPRRITWKQNGRLVMEIAIVQVAFSPAVQDGIFNRPVGL